MKTRHQEKASSVEPQAQAQPSGSQTTAKRTSRKRRASTSSETSVQPAASQDSSSQTKRRKKTRDTVQDPPQDEHPNLEPLVEEQSTAPDVPQSKQVRFSEDAHDDSDKAAAAANLTPHVRKQSVHRRITLSPADLRMGVKPSVNGKSRASLPAVLSSDNSPVNGGPEIDFVPLRDLIQQRIEQRLKEKKSLLQIDGSDDLDMEEEEDMMVYNGHEDGITYPKLLAPPALKLRRVSETSETYSSSETHARSSLSDSKWEQERAAFEDAVRRLTRDASDAKAALQILQIELQSLGFGGAETDTEAVLSSIRESFKVTRERLEAALPGQLPSDASNAEIVDLINESIASFVDQTEAQKRIIADKDQLEKELITEINALVDRLTKAEIRKSKLESANGEFDAQGQEDERYIQEMEQKLARIGEQHNLVAALVGQKDGDIVLLKQENKALEDTIDKLGKALDKYRVAEQSLQNLVTRLEQEHATALARVENDHKEDTDRIISELKDETTMRKTAEADADDKQSIITNLEVRYEKAQVTLDDLNQQLVDIEAAETVERSAKETAENERDEKTAFITSLESKIEQAEVDFEELHNQLGQLRERIESERRQREAAETELDEGNAKVSDLESKLQKHGIEANELRQKLFEIQMREQKAIKELKETATEREEQFQTSMGDEISRREEADTLAAQRLTDIQELEERLADVEDLMRDSLAEKDKEIAKLAAQVKKLEKTVDQYSTELDATADELQALQTTSDARIIQLERAISALEESLSSHADTISGLKDRAASTAETHATAISERDTQIADLNHEVYLAQQQIAALDKDKSSLERRVESEAEAMLELQANKDDEVNDLQTAIRRKQAEIQHLSQKAEEVDRAWNALMRQKDSEIGGYTSVVTEKETEITKLQSESRSIKDMFTLFVRDATATTDSMRAELDAARNAVTDKDRLLKEHGEKVLLELDRLDTISEMQPPEQRVVKKTKKSKKTTRHYDNGVGDGEEESILA